MARVRPLKRKPAKRPAVIQPPPRASLYAAAYARRLIAFLNLWYDHVETAARQALGSRHDARVDANFTERFSEALTGERAPRFDSLEDDLRAAYETILRASGLEDFLARMGGDIYRKQRGYTQRVTKIPPAYDPGRQALLEKFRRDNVALVTKMGEDQRAQIGDILRRAQSDGSRWEDIAPEIQGRLGVGKSRARLIARDQTNKFNSSAQQATQRAAGVSKYRWSTSKDLAVRGRPGGEYAKSKENHWALEGKMFAWTDPPLIPGTSERAHPGERIQCRCVAVPVIPLFEGE